LPLQVRSPVDVVGNLQRVVVGSAEIAPSVQRTELVTVEGVRAELTVWECGTQLRLGGRQIHFEQGESLVMWETVPQFVDVLRGCRSSGIIAVSANETVARELALGDVLPCRKDILEERDGLDLIDIRAEGGSFREHC